MAAAMRGLFIERSLPMFIKGHPHATKADCKIVPLHSLCDPLVKELWFRGQRMFTALSMLVLDPKIVAFLNEHDPQALRQARDALFIAEHNGSAELADKEPAEQTPEPSRDFFMSRQELYRRLKDIADKLVVAADELVVDRLVTGRYVRAICMSLVNRSAWFQLEPRPDDKWQFTFKTGEGLEQLIDKTIRDCDLDDAKDTCGGDFAGGPPGSSHRHEGIECAHCGEMIQEESDGESTPQGSMHAECAFQHEKENPDEW
jgi:hypothetical protein